MINIAEAQTECISEGRNCKIEDIAEIMKEKENVTIEKYYNEETALIKEEITENIINLKGIVVSENKYSKYKFLIGKSTNIEGILLDDITDETKIEDFNNIEEFEIKNFENIIDLPNNENKLYLYKSGNEYEEKTGGWASNIYNYSPTFKKNDDSLEIIGQGDACCSWNTVNKVPIQGYSKLCAIVAGKGDIEINIGCDRNNYGVSMECWVATERETMNGELRKLELDIPEEIRNDEFYIRFVVGYLGDGKNAYLYEAYLEK